MTWARALQSQRRWLPWILAVLGLVVAAVKLARAPNGIVIAAVATAAASWLAVALRGWLGGPSSMDAALAVDRRFEQGGAVPAAWEVLIERRRQDGYAQLLVERLPDPVVWRPKEVQPLPWRRTDGVVVAMFAALGVLLALRLPARQSLEQADFAEVEADKEPLLSRDAAELTAAEAEELAREMTSAPGAEQAASYNEIVERLVAGELTKQEAFRLIDELKSDVADAAGQAERFAEGLRQRGEALSKASLGERVGQALKQPGAPDAEQALRELAERLRDASQPLSEQELEELRKSIQEARKANEATQAAARNQQGDNDAQRQRLEDKRRRLLQKKNQGTATQAELDELQRTKRRLERLSRHRKESGAQKALSELDKELAKAARELAKEREQAGKFMDQAARSLERGKQKQLSDEEKRKLIEQLKKLKERLRKERESGDLAERMRRFQQRARGQKPGQGQGEQRAGQGSMPVPIPVPMPGQQPGSGANAGKEGGQQGQQPQAGREPGHAHDPNLTGDASAELDSRTEDKTAVAQDSGQGPSASETILSAAEEGFSSVAYERLYQDYETVAEEVVGAEEIPPGHRRHVERYFELIRPRAKNDQ